jgi:hypothetical protein
MSVMVTVKTEMTNVQIAIAACERRFENVRINGNQLTANVKLAGRTYGAAMTLDLDTLTIRCDSDYRTSMLQALDEAYRAEEVIVAAEDEGRMWEETRNEEGELVLEVEYA